MHHDARERVIVFVGPPDPGQLHAQIDAHVDHQRGQFVASYRLRGGGRATHRDTMMLPVGVTVGGRILRAAAVSCARAPAPSRPPPPLPLRLHCDGAVFSSLHVLDD